MRLLVVEDHRDIASAINDYFEALGHTVDIAYDGVTGSHFSVTNEYDALIVDVGLPGMDGLQLVRDLRAKARRSTPVLILTARDTLDDKLAGFSGGADDYLVKPFELPELEARLAAIVRRGVRPEEQDRLIVADLVLDLMTRRIVRAGNTLQLTPTQQRLLITLMQNSHRVVTRAELEHEIWGDDPPDSDVLRTHIAAIRAAVDKPFNRRLVHTVHSIGFRLCDENEL